MSIAADPRRVTEHGLRRIEGREFVCWCGFATAGRIIWSEHLTGWKSLLEPAENEIELRGYVWSDWFYDYGEFLGQRIVSCALCSAAIFYGEDDHVAWHRGMGQEPAA